MSGSVSLPRSSVFVLASASQARASLLHHAGVGLRLFPSDVDEDALKARLVERGHGGGVIARRLAEEKALDVSVRVNDALVIGGDQTLVQGARLFSKAVDRSDAIQTLATLSGREHALHSAYAFAWRGRLVSSGVESATLRLRSLDKDEIIQYVDAVGPTVYKSVGCYQIEALGRGLFAEIDGDHSTILGLPLTPVLGFLRAWSEGGRTVSC